MKRQECLSASVKSEARLVAEAQGERVQRACTVAGRRISSSSDRQAHESEREREEGLVSARHCSFSSHSPSSSLAHLFSLSLSLSPAAINFRKQMQDKSMQIQGENGCLTQATGDRKA